jgi:hypothetical protein
MGIECMVSAIPSADVKRFLDDCDGMESLVGGQRAGMFVSLEKAWHGLHYLLTGSAAEADLPLGFILQGGAEVGGDLGYGPPRMFTDNEVRHLHTALEAVSDDILWSRFNPEAMSAAGVYPEIWDEPESDLREEYTHYFHELKKLIAKANAEGHGLLVVLT